MTIEVSSPPDEEQHFEIPVEQQAQGVDGDQESSIQVDENMLKRLRSLKERRRYGVQARGLDRDVDTIPAVITNSEHDEDAIRLANQHTKGLREQEKDMFKDGWRTSTQRRAVLERGEKSEVENRIRQLEEKITALNEEEGGLTNTLEKEDYEEDLKDAIERRDDIDMFTDHARGLARVDIETDGRAIGSSEKEIKELKERIDTERGAVLHMFEQNPERYRGMSVEEFVGLIPEYRKLRGEYEEEMTTLWRLEKLQKEMIGVKNELMLALKEMPKLGEQENFSDFHDEANRIFNDTIKNAARDESGKVDKDKLYVIGNLMGDITGIDDITYNVRENLWGQAIAKTMPRTPNKSAADEFNSLVDRVGEYFTKEHEKVSSQKQKVAEVEQKLVEEGWKTGAEEEQEEVS